MTIAKQTALSAAYRDLGVTIRVQDGWQMPDQFTSPHDERHALIANAGLVDMSHLHKLDLKGSGVHSIPALPDRVDFWQLSAHHALITGRDDDIRGIGNLGVSVVDVTSVYAAFALIGPKSRTILQRLFALDVSTTAFPDRSCAQSKAAEVHVTLCRKDIGGLPRFLLLIGRDVAESFRESVLHVGQADVSPAVSPRLRVRSARRPSVEDARCG